MTPPDRPCGAPGLRGDHEPVVLNDEQVKSVEKHGALVARFALMGRSDPEERFTILTNGDVVMIQRRVRGQPESAYTSAIIPVHQLRNAISAKSLLDGNVPELKFAGIGAAGAESDVSVTLDGSAEMLRLLRYVAAHRAGLNEVRLITDDDYTSWFVEPVEEQARSSRRLNLPPPIGSPDAWAQQVFDTIVPDYKAGSLISFKTNNKDIPESFVEALRGEARRRTDLAFAAKAKAEIDGEVAQLVKRLNSAEALAKMLPRVERERDAAEQKARDLQDEMLLLRAKVFEKQTSAVTHAKETVLDEAARLTSQDRRSSYGHPLDNHGKTAALFTAYLGEKLRNPISAREVCWLNVFQKGSRDSYQDKRDNLTDGCGYLRNAEMIETEIERRNDGEEGSDGE